MQFAIADFCSRYITADHHVGFFGRKQGLNGRGADIAKPTRMTPSATSLVVIAASHR
jgi:hypothetical protein